MKKNYYILFVMVLCLVQSCESSKNEWAEDKEPVGEMRFDGVLFRETGYYRSLFAPNAGDEYYGSLSLIQKNGVISLLYWTKGMTNKDNTIRATFQVIHVENTYKDRFNGGTIHYSPGEGRERIVLTIIRQNNKEYYEAIDADFLISNVEVTSVNDTYTSFYFDTEYSMNVIDSLGITHQVEGWAHHGPGDNR